ncbi:hypothetical protein MJO28_016297 [Puccinia striiformis f. sp. tritici]|uniref:Uncharacterized protein n=1 Tax=Puccinia striiformis f. sp. tritici TaxID=168172 RepID=A0ACC0DNQ6_9BASI|nr:hypothetical protein MJO28_016297 [Puccinia striiformis f. sp. tritici]
MVARNKISTAVYSKFETMELSTVRYQFGFTLQLMACNAFETPNHTSHLLKPSTEHRLDTAVPVLFETSLTYTSTRRRTTRRDLGRLDPYNWQQTFWRHFFTFTICCSELRTKIP